jgi:hypothetical protein
MARNEFNPPSDFVAEDDGGGKRNIWKWLGIGCGVIALVVGGLLAAGAWKTVSCCNDAVDSARLTMAAGEFGTQFARSLGSDGAEQARAKMTDELRSSISLEQLETQISQYQHFFEASSGRLGDLNARKEAVDEPMIWKVTVEFSPPAGQEKLIVLTEVVSRGEGDAQHFLIDDLQFEARSRDLGAEPPAVEVLDFHRQIRGGSYEQAYRHMSNAFTQKSNVEAFRSFVQGQDDVFRTGKVDINAVSYDGSGGALVRARLTSDDGRVQVEYELVRPNPTVAKWLISSVTPTYELVDPAVGANGVPDAGTKKDAGTKQTGPEEAGADVAERVEQPSQ